MDTPQQIIPHEPKYQPKAWQQYTLMELGAWVHNLHKRAGHRSDKAKAAKDLEDAQNYLEMMREYLTDAKLRLT